MAVESLSWSCVYRERKGNEENLKSLQVLPKPPKLKAAADKKVSHESADCIMS